MGITERKWDTIPPRAFALNGLANGSVYLSTTKDFKVKQKVVISATGLATLSLEVKRVISPTQLIVGPVNSSMTIKQDLSAYTLATSPTIRAEEQDRSGIPTEQHERAVYAEEPIMAKRVIPVDRFGNINDKDSPLYVQLSDGSITIGTVNAEVEVQLSHLDNDPDAGDVHDSVRIGDGADVLAINPDGSINVNLIQSPPDYEQSRNIYDEVLGVASGSETLIVSFTATSSSKRYSLQRAEFTGENIALYRLYINGQNIATKRTHHGSGLSGNFEFIGGSQEGLFLTNGDVVELKVLHNRPFSGDFEGRIQIFEAGTNVSYDSMLDEDGFFILTEDGDTIGLEV